MTSSLYSGGVLNNDVIVQPFLLVELTTCDNFRLGLQGGISR